MSDSSSTSERNVTFSEIFGVREYRAVFSATQLSWIGDYLAKAAVMVLVFVESDSVLLAAAAFAISYVPWALGGPFLATLAERYRYRAVMIICDVLRAVFIALVALPGNSIWLMLVLLFLVALLAPPAQAARSAVLPLILTGDRVTLGIAVTQTGGQATQVLGYMAGALIAIINPRLALLVNAVTFLTSALITRYGLRDRPPAMRTDQRSHLLRETREGFRIVFGTPTLRIIAVVVFASMLFSIVPEGLAIGWAHNLAGDDGARRGWYQGLIMVANPVGSILAALLVARLLRPSVRRRLTPVFAVAAPLALVPSLANPGIVGVVAMATISGLAIAGMFPVLNGIFVQILRHGYRARAFGVMNSGVQVIQGAAVLVTAGIVNIGVFSLPTIVGLWSAAGVALMLVLVSHWPRQQVFTDAIAEATAANEAAQATATTGTPSVSTAAVVPSQSGAARTEAEAGASRGEWGGPVATATGTPAGPGRMEK